MAVLVLLFLLLAAVLAGLAAFNFAGRVNLLAAGFCSFVIAVLIEHIG